MVRDAAFDADPERADLPRRCAIGVHPAARVPVAPARCDAEGSARVGERRLEGSDVGPQEKPAVGETQDRVGHQLARPVVGHLAATLDAQHLDAPSPELVGGREDMRLVGLPAEREDGWMLEQQQLVADPPVGARGRESLLEVPRVAVGHPAQPPCSDRPIVHGFAR